MIEGKDIFVELKKYEVLWIEHPILSSVKIIGHNFNWKFCQKKLKSLQITKHEDWRFCQILSSPQTHIYQILNFPRILTRIWKLKGNTEILDAMVV